MFRGVVRHSLNVRPNLRQQLVLNKQSLRLFSTRHTLCQPSDQGSNPLGDSILSKASSESSNSSGSAERSAESSSSSPSSTTSSDVERANSITHSWNSVLAAIVGQTGSGPLDHKDFEGSSRDPNVMASGNPADFGKPVDLEVEFEEVWKRRQVRGPRNPAKPVDGRTISIEGFTDCSRGYQILNSILGRNNVRNELRLGERYEKPNQKRRRLRSERHRRRFADAVKQKVQLVSQNWGTRVVEKKNDSNTDNANPLHLQIMELKARGS